MSKVKPNIDLSLYRIDEEDISLCTSFISKRKEQGNTSLVQLRSEFDGFSHINMMNPRHRQEIMSMFPDYLIEQANPDDMALFKLAKRLAKTFGITQEEAMELIYEEWDLVESLFHAHTKVKAVHMHLIDEINYTYRIA